MRDITTNLQEVVAQEKFANNKPKCKPPQFQAAHWIKSNEEVKANLRHIKKDPIHHTLSSKPTPNEMEQFYWSIYSSIDSFTFLIQKQKDLTPWEQLNQRIKKLTQR